MSWQPMRLSQPKRGYRYSVDALLLAAFAARFRPRRWLDLGTGCGVVAAHLSAYLSESRGMAVERQPELAAHARTNLAAAPVGLIEGDARTFPWRREVFDLIACNPPYYAHGSGRLKKDPVAAAARHALHGDLVDFCDALFGALTPQGRFCAVLPCTSYERMEPRLVARGWFPWVRLWVRPFADRVPNLVCFALGKTLVDRPCSGEMVLYRAHRLFSERAQDFFALRGDEVPIWSEDHSLLE